MQHYFTGEIPKRITKTIIAVTLRGRQFQFHSQSGIFSVEKIDKGTQVLIQNAEIPTNAKVLDLGCGYGAIGIAIAKTHPTSIVELCDIHMIAVNLAKQNIKENKVENAKAYRSATYNKVRTRFDTILTNPPFSAGRKVCYQFIEEAPRHLELNGTLQLVAPHQKGGKMLQKKMLEVFGNVEIIAKKSGFRLYKSTR